MVETLEVAVDDVAAGGDGIGRAPDGRVVFVDGGVPGDTVAVHVTADKSRMLRGRAVAVVHASPDRTAAPCPYAATCGGCSWQHVSLAAQRRHKVRIVEESLRRIARLETDVGLGPALPAEGFRTTVRILVHGGRAAFRAERSHDPVAIERCLVAHPAIDELITHGRFGDAREATLRVGAATGERLVVVDPGVPDELELPADVRVAGTDELAAGRRAWFTDEVGGHRFRISAGSFFQTRTDGAAALVDEVRRAGDGHWGRGRLVDLYGGVGLFARTVGDGMPVTLVEANRSAAADARHNLVGRDAHVLRLDAARWRPSPADVVVADPPRAGLGRAVATSVAATGAGRVVLVSCDPASFARDARLLADAGYRLHGTTVVDLFPHTAHIELVSRFDRVGG